MKKTEQATMYFVTGSQHLYGEDVLKEVGANSAHIASTLNDSSHIQVPITYKGVVTTEQEIFTCM